MKKFILAGLAAAAVIAPIATTAGSAHAATVDATGAVTVSKGEIKSIMKWNDAAWDAHLQAGDIDDLITASHGNEPVDVPGGWLTLNGQIVANYPSDEYYSSSFTNPENWGPFSTSVTAYWDGGVKTEITPVYTGGKDPKVNGYKVTAAPTADDYVYWTRHTTYTNPEYAGATYVYHATSRWPASVAGSGVSDVKVNGTPVTVTQAA